MIACHRKYLEQRCLERGRNLESAMGCVVAMDGDMWTVDVDHSSYPRPDLGTLSFKCVPDCTTPEFPCEPGFCCEENLFDGTNSCLPCPSSSSSSSQTTCNDGSDCADGFCCEGGFCESSSCPAGSSEAGEWPEFNRICGNPCFTYICSDQGTPNAQCVQVPNIFPGQQRTLEECEAECS